MILKSNSAPSFRTQKSDNSYDALKKKLQQLALHDKSFRKHVKQLYQYEKIEDQLQAKHFEEATEVGGQVLDDFIHHRIKIMAASVEKKTASTDGRKSDKKVANNLYQSIKPSEPIPQPKMNKKLQNAVENVDADIEGMRRQDRRKLAATWNSQMEKAYVEFLHKGRSNRKTLALKGASDEAVDNQTRVRQEMANFLRFGKITIKLETSQKNKYRHRLVGGADGNRRIVREIINQPSPMLIQLNPVKSQGNHHANTTSLWKKIKSKVKKIGDARKLTDKSYGTSTKTGFSDQESAVAEFRLAEHILTSHNWGVEDYMHSRAQYLKVRSKHRAAKNQARRKRIQQLSKLRQNRRQFMVDVNRTRMYLEALQKKPHYRVETLAAKWRWKKSHPLEDGDSMPSTTMHTYMTSKRLGKKWKDLSAKKEEGEAEDDYFVEEDENVEASSVIQEESEVAQPAFKRLRRQTNRYLYKVKNRGGGGFAKEQGQIRVSEATLHESAIILQKYMRAYISRRYVWGKRWLLQEDNQHSIFLHHSSGRETLDLRPFAVLAGMLGRSLPQQRTIANHKFVAKYDLYKQHGCTFTNFKKWFEDEDITRADNMFQQIRVQQLARVQVYDVCNIHV